MSRNDQELIAPLEKTKACLGEIVSINNPLFLKDSNMNKSSHELIL